MQEKKAPLMFHSPHIPPFPVMVMKKSFCKGKIRLPPDDSSLRSETEKPAEKERDRIHTGWSQVGNVFLWEVQANGQVFGKIRKNLRVSGGGRALKEVQNGANDRI